MMAWLVAYLVTCAVEIPIVVAAVRTLGWRPTGPHPLAGTVAVAWLLQVTHPVFWLVNPAFPSGVLLAEVVIVLVEAATLYLWATLRAGEPHVLRTAALAASVSFVANGASFAVGLLASVVQAGR